MPSLKDTMENVRETALEVGIYLPLGAYSTVRDRVVDLDAGKVKSFYGSLVDRGQDRLDPLERTVRRRKRKVERAADRATDQVSRDVKRTARRATGTAKETASEAAKSARKAGERAEASADALAPKMPRVATPRRASDLPIAKYDSLTVGEIAAATKGLTQTELAQIYKYEKANQDRTTVLEAVEAKFVDLPIPSYDALTADEINGRLEGLGDAELKTIRRYEADTKARSTVLEKVDSLLGTNA